MEKFTTGTGQIMTVHNKKDCKGYCPIHNPSDHHMKDWPLHWRSDLWIFERIDPEGVGHPDPDSITFIEQIDPLKAAGLSIHGCNGLCNEKIYKRYKDERINTNI